MLAGLHDFSPQLLQQGLLQQRCPGSCAYGSACERVDLTCKIASGRWQCPFLGMSQ